MSIKINTIPNPPIGKILIQGHNGEILIRSNYDIDNDVSLQGAKEKYLQDEYVQPIFFKATEGFSNNVVFGSLTIQETEELIASLQSMVNYIKG